MQYLSVAETAKRWKISERAVRNYCAQGRVEGAFLTGKTWNIPEYAEKPGRIKRESYELTLLDQLRKEKESKLPGGLYHKLQIDLTYNSNHIEGSRLTHDQTRYIFETNTIGITEGTVNIDDIVETANHFRCIDMVIENARYPLSERMMKNLHLILKNGTQDSRQEWFAVGDYKRLPNQVGGHGTTLPENVSAEIRKLLKNYKPTEPKTLEDILDFHVRFEKIHPFQDGNGRIGRLIMLKECLKHNITPFIISEDLKLFYYRGLAEWSSERGYLIETCKEAQELFEKVLEYFRIGR